MLHILQPQPQPRHQVAEIQLVQSILGLGQVFAGVVDPGLRQGGPMRAQRCGQLLHQRVERRHTRLLGVGIHVGFWRQYRRQLRHWRCLPIGFQCHAERIQHGLGLRPHMCRTPFGNIKVVKGL